MDGTLFPSRKGLQGSPSPDVPLYACRMPHRAPHQAEREAEAEARHAHVQRSFSPGTGGDDNATGEDDARPWTVWAYAALAFLFGLIEVIFGDGDPGPRIAWSLVGLAMIYLFVRGSKLVWALGLIGGVSAVVAFVTLLFVDQRETLRLIQSGGGIVMLSLLLAPATRRWFEPDRRAGL